MLDLPFCLFSFPFPCMPLFFLTPTFNLAVRPKAGPKAVVFSEIYLSCYSTVSYSDTRAPAISQVILSCTLSEITEYFLRDLSLEVWSLKPLLKENGSNFKAIPVSQGLVQVNFYYFQGYFYNLCFSAALLSQERTSHPFTAYPRILVWFCLFFFFF